MFLMDGPKKTTECVEPKDHGHDNNIFSVADETNLPTITSMVVNSKSNLHETSRL